MPDACSRAALRRRSCAASPARSAPPGPQTGPLPCRGGEAPAGGSGPRRAGSRTASGRYSRTSTTPWAWPRSPASRGGSPMDTLAEALAASRRFGAFTAVSAADLLVGRGEVVGLLGANGAGKTTLIRLLLGLVRPSDGVVRLFGAAPSRPTRRRVGYVPQTLGLYAGLTVAENWAFTAAAFGNAGAAVPG